MTDLRDQLPALRHQRGRHDQEGHTVSTDKTPAVVEVRVKHKGHEFTVTRRQEADRIGRPTESVAETMRAATADAQAWIRRNR